MSNLMHRILRQYVAGIDIQREEARIVVLSHRWLSASAVRFEYAARRPLPTDVYEEGEWISPDDITLTLSELTSDAKKACQSNLNRLVMALPTNIVWLDEIELHPDTSHAPRNAHAAAWLNELEPLVLTQAEQNLGIPAADIAADWFLQNPQYHPNRLTIVAAPRSAIEVRMECAAHLELRLSAIDGEAAAALRACRFAAAHEVPADTAYAVIWFGAREVEAYLLCPSLPTPPTNQVTEPPSTDNLLTQLSTHSIARETCFTRQRLSGASLIDRLHELIDSHNPKYLWFAGEPGAFNALEAKGFNTNALALALGCVPRRFDPTLYSLPSQNKETKIPLSAAQDPCFALAFGLALRGVLE